MTAADEQAMERVEELLADRARLELFAEHAVAELLASLRTRGEPGAALTFCDLSGEQALQLVRLGKTALGIGDLPEPRAVRLPASLSMPAPRFAVGGGI